MSSVLIFFKITYEFHQRSVTIKNIFFQESQCEKFKVDFDILKKGDFLTRDKQYFEIGILTH